MDHVKMRRSKQIPPLSHLVVGTENILSDRAEKLEARCGVIVISTPIYLFPLTLAIKLGWG